MARQPRSLLPEYGIFHVTARGVARCEIYLDDTDRQAFVDDLRHIGGSLRWKCAAFCLMGNHYHALIEAYRESLSAGLHRLNGNHAQRFNRRHARVGHLFQGRFHARVLRDDEHLSYACDYIWNNPVRAEICLEAHDWPWSGYF